MNHSGKALLQQAMQLTGFENWQPEVDVPQLNRPRCRPEELEGIGRVAAVLVLLYVNPETNRRIGPSFKTGFDDFDLKLVLTKRHTNLSNHGGQISFPGGRQESGESLWQTAKRETLEEVGIEFQNIELLGRLNSVYIPPSDFTVQPFVGWHHGRPGFVRAEEEVDEIIEASVRDLLDPAFLCRGDIESASGMKSNVPYYCVDGHQVWGATAIMLGELIERIRRVNF